MITKIIGFSFLTYWLGNPFLALIVLLVILYFIDRRFIGLSPSIAKPFQQLSRVRKLRQQLRLSPYDTSAKLELARLLMLRRKHQEAASLLAEVLSVMDDSAEVRCELGYCLLRTGRQPEGQQLLEQGLALHPKVKYGQPYLWLAESLAEQRPADAAAQLEKFKDIQSSSCEAYYLLGRLYRRLGQEPKAAAAFKEATAVYRSLPRYKKRNERRWALLSWLQTLSPKSSASS